MARVVDALAGWARRTPWSALTERRAEAFADTEMSNGPGEPIYRLRQWPSLPTGMRTADVLRLLSLMSNRPVNRAWMLKHSQLRPDRVDGLLRELRRQEALDVIDPSGFPGQAAAAP